MRKLIKSLFLPLAVFAMVGLGVLTLSASNVTNDVVRKTEAASMQAVYTGDLYVVDATQPSGFRLVIVSPKPDHCTFDPTSNTPCTAIVDGMLVSLYGYTGGATPTYKQLYEI